MRAVAKISYSVSEKITVGKEGVLIPIRGLVYLQAKNMTGYQFIPANQTGPSLRLAATLNDISVTVEIIKQELSEEDAEIVIALLQWSRRNEIMPIKRNTSLVQITSVADELNKMGDALNTLTGDNLGAGLKKKGGQLSRCVEDLEQELKSTKKLPEWEVTLVKGGAPNKLHRCSAVSNEKAIQAATIENPGWVAVNIEKFGAEKPQATVGPLGKRPKEQVYEVGLELESGHNILHECSAESVDHAREKTQAAFPGCQVRSVKSTAISPTELKYKEALEHIAAIDEDKYEYDYAVMASDAGAFAEEALGKTEE